MYRCVPAAINHLLSSVRVPRPDRLLARPTCPDIPTPPHPGLPPQHAFEDSQLLVCTKLWTCLSPQALTTQSKALGKCTTSRLTFKFLVLLHYKLHVYIPYLTRPSITIRRALLASLKCFSLSSLRNPFPKALSCPCRIHTLALQPKLACYDKGHEVPQHGAPQETRTTPPAHNNDHNNHDDHDKRLNSPLSPPWNLNKPDQ